LSARRRIITVWAGLCLVGLAATSALNYEPGTGDTGSPAEEPTPTTGAYAVDCQEIADYIAQGRGEAELEQHEVPSPNAIAEYQSTVVDVIDVAVPEECADELEDRGLKAR